MHLDVDTEKDEKSCSLSWSPASTYSFKSDYDQEMPKAQTTDNPWNRGE